MSIISLANMDPTTRIQTVGEIHNLFDPFGWSGSKPEKWGTVADATIVSVYGNLPITFVEMNNGLVIGTISSLLIDSKRYQRRGPWVAGMVVHPNHRNQGHGTRLLQYAEEYFRALAGNGHPAITDRTIYLETERIWNPLQPEYYAKHGWLIHPDNEGEQEEILMYKKLAA